MSVAASSSKPQPPEDPAPDMEKSQAAARGSSWESSETSESLAPKRFWPNFTRDRYVSRSALPKRVVIVMESRSATDHSPLLGQLSKIAWEWRPCLAAMSKPRQRRWCNASQTPPSPSSEYSTSHVRARRSLPESPLDLREVQEEIVPRLERPATELAAPLERPATELTAPLHRSVSKDWDSKPLTSGSALLDFSAAASGPVRSLSFASTSLSPSSASNSKDTSLVDMARVAFRVNLMGCACAAPTCPAAASAVNGAVKAACAEVATSPDSAAASAPVHFEGRRPRLGEAATGETGRLNSGGRDPREASSGDHPCASSSIDCCTQRAANVGPARSSNSRISPRTTSEKPSVNEMARSIGRSGSAGLLAIISMESGRRWAASAGSPSL
mmetsp:Transcript_123290/g.356230  ORF Transcript_123290/g.356230 Transcript_123290/m.356230 type:complete len:387 (+) Transcript_123290:2126-3286(+)